MPPDERGSSNRPALAASASLCLAGLLYGLAEFARQAWWKPSPPGIPGDSGGELLAYLALGLSVVTLPGLLAWIVLGTLRTHAQHMRWALSWFAALLPTTLLALDRFAELLRWDWTLYEIGGAAYYVRLLALGSAVLVVPCLVLALSKPLQRTGGRVGLVVLLLAVLAPFVLGAHLMPATARAPSAAQPVPVAPSVAPCVLLITVDTLRQDALEPYGGPVALPPPMADARSFEGWSVSSWTLPAMASLFSTLAPTGHGADEHHSAAPTVAWWPELWRDLGWNTAAVISNPFLRRRFGFDRGFTHFEHAEELHQLEPIARSFWAEWWQRRVFDRTAPDRADRRVDRALHWLRGAGAERPWLLWVHLMDPHLPYHLRGEAGALQPPERPEWVHPIAHLLEQDRFTDLRGARGGTVLGTADEREALHRLYHTEVDFAMHWLGELVVAAREAAGDREFLWVLSSDHGEEFWEDGGFEHGHSLHDTVLRVPLLAGGSAAPHLRLEADTRLRLIDLGPLLTARAGPGIEFEARRESGLLETASPLDDHALGRIPDELVPLLAEGMLYGPPRTLMVDVSGAGIERRDDTREWQWQRRWNADRDSSATEHILELLLELDLWRERNAGRGATIAVDPDLERRLRAVGYVR